MQQFITTKCFHYSCLSLRETNYTSHDFLGALVVHAVACVIAVSDDP